MCVFEGDVFGNECEGVGVDIGDKSLWGLCLVVF